MLQRNFHRQNQPPLKTPSVLTFSKTAYNVGCCCLMYKSCATLCISSLLKDSIFIVTLEACNDLLVIKSICYWPKTECFLDILRYARCLRQSIDYIQPFVHISSNFFLFQKKL